jgi:hypothetical protein
MTIHSTLLLFSTILTISRPILQYGVCPALSRLEIAAVDKTCDFAVNVATTVPTVIGASYGMYAIGSSPVLLIKSFIANTHRFILPAGLGMITVNTLFNPEHLPSASLFAIGTLKSAFEMTTSQQIAKDILHQNVASPLFSLSHPVFAGGVTAINIAQSTNTLFYTIKTMFDENNDLSLTETLRKGSDYAFAYSAARSFYQIGSIVQDKEILNMPFFGAVFFFSAPIVRGCFLSFSETGSVTVPGKKVDYSSNVLDGIAIASTSLMRTHLHNDISSDHSLVKEYLPSLEYAIKTIGVGNSLTVPFMAIIGIANIADNSTEEL